MVDPSAPDPGIRTARPSEYPLLRQIEAASDQLFAQVGIGPLASSLQDDQLAEAAAVFVSGSPPVGFACLTVVDGEAHLWQLSVLPSAGRQGRGTALVEAVCDWARQQGLPSVTLTTFRDVAWNAPFYARLGFRETDELGPGLLAVRRHETAIGDDGFGVRIAMRRFVGPQAAG
ncbi:MAG TPA: GNAT family N-acetyltransferase [Acidimicrobiales bacterium]|nr:GNAT family N-acetyltransferase [Acidimicrobiales bacterium]